jgi:hypothetical protein
VTAPVLEVDDARLDFTDFTQAKSITIKNTGDASLDFRILADKTWLAATPVTGTVAAGSSSVVAISVQQSGTGTWGTVSVVSTGGSASVTVSIPETLTGLYQGEVHITSPSDLGNRALGIGLAQQASGALQGVVDDARSPAFGFRAALDASSAVSGQTVSIKFVIPGRTGSGANPSYPQNILRTITINGMVAAGGGITGEYVETLQGALSAPVVISGTVSLAPIDRAASLLPPQADSFDLQALPAPSFLACDICPSGACPADDVQAGRQFLTAAFSFYSSPLADGTNDAYAPIRACVDAPANCYNPIALHCAQAHFYKAIQAGGTHSCPDIGSGDCAQRGLLDTFKGLLVWNSLFGNEHLVRAYELGRSLDEQHTELDTARAAFAAGYLGDSTGGARVWGILDPFFVNWLAGLPASVWSTPQISLLPEQLEMANAPDPSKTVAPFADFARLATDLDLWIQALRNELDAQHRMNADDPEDLVLQAGRDAADTHVSLALAAALQASIGATGKLSSAVGHAGQLSSKVSQIGAGLNPAGYPDQYIAYTYNSALGAASNNYLELMKDLRGNWLANAMTTFAAAQGIQRDFESSFQSLTQQLVAVNSDYGKKIADLCGGGASSPTTLNCGESGGQVFDTAQQIQSAYLRLQNATVALSNQYDQIEIEQNRAAQQVDLHDVTAMEITEDGQKLKALQDRETKIDELQAVAAAAASSAGSTSFAGGAANAAAGAVNVYAAYAKGEIEKDRINIDTIAKARVEYDQAQEQLIDSAARVKTMLLEIPTLHINGLLAVEDIGRLLGQLRSQVQDAQDAAAALSSMDQLSKVDPRRDPAFREYRDETTMIANKAFDDAQSQLFLVTRALEYEVGMSFSRRADLFTLVTPADLASYAADLDSAYQRFIATVGNSQQREITLSLRDQIFRFADALQDNATGGIYTPEDVFHRLLAEPRNRDADGNVRLTFSLSLTPDALIFNSSFCTDKITGIRVSLVGSALGATQPEVGLQQRGSAYLRSCTDTDANGAYVVSDYNLENTIGVRRAIVQAGLNLSGPTDMSSGGPVDTEFYGRPIAAPYELIIDRNAPANANLDLTKLDDIVLFIQHETRTVH